jgi:hypothetical protein
MKEPKTMRGKLKALIEICHWGSELSGNNDEENGLINICVTMIQNELGKNDEILDKYKVEWRG